MREREGQGQPQAVFPPRSLLGSAATRNRHTHTRPRTHSHENSPSLTNAFPKQLSPEKGKQQLCVCCFSGVYSALKSILFKMKSPVCFLTGRMELIQSVTGTQLPCADLRMSLDCFPTSELVFFWIRFLSKSKINPPKPPKNVYRVIKNIQWIVNISLRLATFLFSFKLGSFQHCCQAVFGL